jgi:hypothetical protein
LALMFFAFIEHDWLYFCRLSRACGMWALSFLACYVASLRTLSTDRALLDFWRNYFSVIQRSLSPSWAQQSLFWDASGWPAGPKSTSRS